MFKVAGTFYYLDVPAHVLLFFKLYKMNRFIFKYLIVALTALFLGGCSNNDIKKYHEGKRDNVIDGTALMVSIDDRLPPIHSYSIPILAGDTLIIQDDRTTDLIFTAYDIYNDSTVGRFGRYGNGPGEIGNTLFSFYNKYNKNLYIGNGNRGKLSSFYLPEAISDSTYNATDRLQLDFSKGILYPYVIDKATILCTTYSDLSSRISRISKMNLNTGEITVIDSVSLGDNERAGIAISEKDNLIFSVDKQHDMIRILDLDCRLISNIYGPEYDETTKDNDYFFSESEICGNVVASIYTGREQKKDRMHIIITDLDGKYIKTLRFEDSVWGMQYHDKTNRLYLTTNGEPQIGYIELDKIPD